VRSSADPDVGRGLPPGGTGPDSGRRSPVPEVGPGRIRIRQPEARRAPFQSAQSAQRISPRSTPVKHPPGLSLQVTSSNRRSSTVFGCAGGSGSDSRRAAADDRHWLPAGSDRCSRRRHAAVNRHHLNFDLLGKRLPVRKTPNDDESSVFAAVLDDPTSAGTQRVQPDHEPNPSRRR